MTPDTCVSQPVQEHRVVGGGACLYFGNRDKTINSEEKTLQSFGFLCENSFPNNGSKWEGK